MHEHTHTYTHTHTVIGNRVKVKLDNDFMAYTILCIHTGLTHHK